MNEKQIRQKYKILKLKSLNDKIKLNKKHK